MSIPPLLLLDHFSNVRLIFYIAIFNKKMNRKPLKQQNWHKNITKLSKIYIYIFHAKPSIFNKKHLKSNFLKSVPLFLIDDQALDSNWSNLCI